MYVYVSGIARIWKLGSAEPSEVGVCTLHECVHAWYHHGTMPCADS